MTCRGFPLILLIIDGCVLISFISFQVKNRGCFEKILGIQYHHQKFQVPKMEVLNLIRLLWGWVSPYISLTYSTAYIGEYLHFRSLKCLVISCQRATNIMKMRHTPPKNQAMHDLKTSSLKVALQISTLTFGARNIQLPFLVHFRFRITLVRIFHE